MFEEGKAGEWRRLFSLVTRRLLPGLRGGVLWDAAAGEWRWARDFEQTRSPQLWRRRQTTGCERAWERAGQPRRKAGGDAGERGKETTAVAAAAMAVEQARCA